MLPEKKFRPIHALREQARRGKMKWRASLDDGHNKDNGNHVGMLPRHGWRERNLRFINDILIPHLLAPRLPGTEPQAMPDLEQDKIGIAWLGHAGFLIHIGGLNVLVDPNWALWHGPVKRVRHPSIAVTDLPYIDLVLITHAHFDHLHMPTLRAVAAGQPIIVPTGVGSIVKRCAFSRIIELDTWESTHFRGLDVTLTPARHWGARMLHDTYRRFGGYLISSKDRTVFHCGDSSLFDGFQEIGKRANIDVALMPIGAYQAPSGRPVHMNPEEALEAFEMLGAQHMIPMHYGTFPLGGEPLHEPEQRLIKAANLQGLADRVIVLPDGHSSVF